MGVTERDHARVAKDNLMKSMIRPTQLALSAALLLIAAACSSLFPAHNPETIRGSGTVTTDTRSIGTFNAVDLSGQGNVILTAGAEPALVIEAEDNFMPYLKSEVSGGKLILSSDDSVVLSPTTPISYHVTYTGSLTELAISGSGTMRADDLTTDALNIVVKGSGQFVLAGSAAQLTFDVSGSGGLDGRNFANQNATIRISGTGSALVNAAQTLDVTVGGTGTISYLGSPTVTKDISGVGSVVALPE